jgi:nitrogen fixation NifU-like protein
VTSDALYHEALLRLARTGPAPARLPSPDARAARDNPLCGDDVEVEVALRGGRVAAVAHRVRGCVLCQAAATVLCGAAPGLTAAELRAVRGEVAAMLAAEGPVPGGAFAELAAFLPVRAVKSRHDCVLLPFDTLGDALARAGE